MIYRFTSAALRELQDAALFYDEAASGLGHQFLDEIEEAIRRILAQPHAWRALSPRTRRCRTHRFPFGLIYRVVNEEIEILSVMDKEIINKVLSFPGFRDFIEASPSSELKNRVLSFR